MHVSLLLTTLIGLCATTTSLPVMIHHSRPSPDVTTANTSANTYDATPFAFVPLLQAHVLAKEAVDLTVFILEGAISDFEGQKDVTSDIGKRNGAC